jgi:hypothetical protein
LAGAGQNQNNRVLSVVLWTCMRVTCHAMHHCQASQALQQAVCKTRAGLIEQAPDRALVTLVLLSHHLQLRLRVETLTSQLAAAQTSANEVQARAAASASEAASKAAAAAEQARLVAQLKWVLMWSNHLS